MGGSARAEVELPSTCEKCGGLVELDRGDAERVRLCCTTCKHIMAVALIPASFGKWTVVDPGGVVRHFASWEDLVGSAGRPRSTRPSSAAALLDVTPPPAAAVPRLALVPADDPPPLPRLVTRSEPVPVAYAEPVANVPPVAESLEDLPDEDVVPASEDSRRALAGFVTLPRSEVKHSVPPPLPPSALQRASSPSIPPPHIPTPLPPRGGMLKTLPPSAGLYMQAPPPPTIDVESDPDMPIAVTTESGRLPEDDEKVVAKPPSDPSLRARGLTGKREREDERAADAAPTPPMASRGWFWPVVGLAVVAAGFWYVMRRPDPGGESVPPNATQLSAPSSAATPAPSVASPSAATTVAAPLASAVPLAAASADPKATGAGEPGERRVVGDSQLGLSEVLERAASARKSGDAAHAKALLLRALELSPGNAEAYGLLGDLQRSQGDNAGAKASYEHALATSPSYFPALLGLADTQWDLGDRDAAQRRYKQIIGLGRPAPERVKERGGDGAGSAPATTPAPTTSAATTSAAPPATTAAPAATAPAATEATPSPPAN